MVYKIYLNGCHWVKRIGVLHSLNLADGQLLTAHVPSHHDHKIGEWIGIKAEVDHVVTFERVLELIIARMRM
jgi:hypothetical protein